MKAAVLRTLRAEAAPPAILSVSFVGESTIARLNRNYLGHRGSTDVISFSLDAAATEAGIIGDIYICPDVIRANAAQRGIGFREELLRAVVHGVLHVLGLDHPEGERRTRSTMWRKQERILAEIV